MDEQTEGAIEALQTRIAYQDITIEDLSSQVFEQRKVIDRLETQVASLSKKIQDIWTGDQNFAPADQKPPHY